MRIGHALIRQQGPTIRCKLASVSWKDNCFNPAMEPYNSLRDFRKHRQLGLLFGVYFGLDIIQNENDFKKLMGPEYEVPAKFDKEAIVINKGDYLMVRKQERTYDVEPAKPSQIAK